MSFYPLIIFGIVLLLLYGAVGANSKPKAISSTTNINFGNVQGDIATSLRQITNLCLYSPNKKDVFSLKVIGSASQGGAFYLQQAMYRLPYQVSWKGPGQSGFMRLRAGVPYQIKIQNISPNCMSAKTMSQLAITIPQNALHHAIAGHYIDTLRLNIKAR